MGIHSRPGETSAPPADSPETSANLELVRRMAARYGGRLEVDPARGALALTVTLPAVAQIPVLAIDDHADTLHLFQRYTVGTPYRLVTTRDPGEALALAELYQPRVILVDVMMPRLDGWDVLTRLRQHPLTRETPIAICTVLAQEELALSLGASLFLHKPVNRDVFIRALEQLVVGPAQTLR